MCSDTFTLRLLIFYEGYVACFGLNFIITTEAQKGWEIYTKHSCFEHTNSSDCNTPYVTYVTKIVLQV